jgi:hypothetical protein
MKIYSIIITIVAVIALGSTGYLYWQYNSANEKVGSLEGKIDSVQKDLDKTKQELTNTKTSFDGIKPFSAALKAVLNSFIAGGDAKVGTIGATEGTLARQKISGITDNTDKISAEKNWDDFSRSAKFSDLQPLLMTLSFGIERNIQNATGPSK